MRTQLWLVDLQLRVFVCYMVGAELGRDLRLNTQITLELVHSMSLHATATYQSIVYSFCCSAR